MSLRDELRPKHSSNLDQDALKELVECNPCKRFWEFALDFNTPQSTVCHHMKKNRKSEQFGHLDSLYSYWEKKDHTSIEINLLSRQRNNLFFRNVITDDGKWDFYDNVQCKRQWIENNES